MGLQQSKDEMLYEKVNCGDVEGVRALRREGAGLEWTDSEGKTPLMVSCISLELYDVAKTLIELGADVNAYCSGRFGGTPLHHAAKRGLDQTVKLLLEHGANALVMNDDCRTPLDIARAKGYTNIIRAIEGHVCLFSGWLREIHGPGFLELLAPQLLSRRVWVVVLPCGFRNHKKSFRLELAIYASAQDAQPRTMVLLWKANLEEPNFNQPDPAVIISNISRIPRRWRKRRAIKHSQEARSAQIKLGPVDAYETLQLQQFSNACKGIPQVIRPSFPINFPVPTAPVGALSTSDSEDEELATATDASLPSTPHERPPHMDSRAGSVVDAPTSSAYSMSSSSHEQRFVGGERTPHMDSHAGSIVDAPTNSAYPTSTSSHEQCFVEGASTTHMAQCEIQQAGPSNYPAQSFQNDKCIPSLVQIPSPDSTPSAPPVANAEDDGPIHYPSIDMNPIDTPSPYGGVNSHNNPQDKKEYCAAPSCTICLDAPLEGACVPCGHMAGCMMCLNEIMTKKWGCPVCRATINQVIRIYSV